MQLLIVLSVQRHQQMRAVGFDDPLDAWRDERGDKVGLAFDLEWERSAPLTRRASERSDGYAMECRVSGDLQVGEETIAIDASGYRMHTWGLADPASLELTEPEYGPVALLRATIQIEMPNGPKRRVMRSLRRSPTKNHRWDLVLIGD